MSQIQVTRRAATAGAISLFAVLAATAQSPQAQAQAQGTAYPITFPSGSAQLHTNDQETIHGVAAMMERTPSLVATVVGRADTVGTPEYNEKLSQRRAQAVVDALVKTNKVPANRVEMNFTGEKQPTVATGDEKAEVLNRTVDIILH